MAKKQTAKNTKSKPTFDLDNMSIQDLQKLVEAVNRQLKEKIDIEKQAIMEETKAKLAKLGISFNGYPKSLPKNKTKSNNKSTSPLPIKYRGPNGEKWVGRGRMPDWLVAQQKQGKNRETFRVK